MARVSAVIAKAKVSKAKHRRIKKKRKHRRRRRIAQVATPVTLPQTTQQTITA